MEIEKIKLSQICVNEKNPRTITENQLRNLVRSLLVFPKMLTAREIIVNDENVILGGNMRYRSLTAIAEMQMPEIEEILEGSTNYQKKTEAEKEALLDFWRDWLQEPTATIKRAEEFSEEEEREFIIKDNVAYGSWDDKILDEEFSEDELIDWGMLDPDEGEEEEKEAEEDGFTDEDIENAPTRCNAGEVWQLGEHILMCGDSTKSDDVEKLMGGY